MDDTSLQRKLLQMEKEVRSLKIAHERGLGVVQMWCEYIWWDNDSANVQFYVYVVPKDSNNFFVAMIGDSVLDITIQQNGTWKFTVTSASIAYRFLLQANNQFTWSKEKV